MDGQLTDNPEEPLAETPEDVAILYSWANLHGAKYRDFSASRREYRAQVRHRAAEDLRLAELEAKAQAEAAAADAERAARDAERIARGSDRFEDGPQRERSLKEAESAARRAAAERVEAARRAEAAAIADAVARREEREIAEAHASAQRQAARWAEAEVRRRSLAGPQPSRARIPGLQSDPYEYAEAPGEEEAVELSREAPDYTSLDRYAERYGRPSSESAEYRIASMDLGSGVRQAYSGERRAFQPELETRRRPQGYRPDEASGTLPAFRAFERQPQARPADAYEAPRYTEPRREEPIDQRSELDSEQLQASPFDSRQRADESSTEQTEQQAVDQSGPAWLYARGNTPVPASTVSDTLQQSRETVASRWFAFKGVFEPGEEPPAAPAQVRSRESRMPILAIFSLAGGVGKTSLTATLGRTLSSLGEKVLLADTTSHGLMPYYFGATELRPGAVRTFSPPSGSTDAPISLVSYEIQSQAAQDQLPHDLEQAASGTNRILLDVNASAGPVIRRLAEMGPKVLVPVSPDMNSVISLQAVEKYFAGVIDPDGRALQPYYVLNQFDAALPLHLDVREVLREKLGDRLLPFVIRRAPAVSEALAEGMTVVDYAPDAGIAEDYLNIANWVRALSAPASQSFRNVRWSEQ